MKRIVFILLVVLSSCSKEPTCVSCIMDNGDVWNGCIEDYNVESTQELIEAVNPLLDYPDCTEY